MARSTWSGRKARFLPGKVSLDVLQKALELRLVGEAFPRPGNIGIQDQRTRNGAASLVAFAAGLKE